MTSPNSHPTAPPTAAPASEQEIAARFADWQQVILNGGPPCFAIEHGPRFCLRAERWLGHKQGFVGTHSFISLETMLASDRAENDRLRARVAELKEVLKAAIGHCDCLDYNGKALIPCTEANPCAGCYMAAQIRAALKPEPR